MTEVGLFSLFLFLHIGAAIIAFGPTFTFPVIGGMGARDPMHANFAVRVTEALEDKFVLPFAISMPFTGVGLIYFGHINLADRSGWWLSLGIVLYVIALYIAVFVQRPTVQHMVKITAGGPPPGAGPAGSAGLGGAAGGPGSGRPAGPPPEVVATARKIQRNGGILGLLIVLIVLLMIVRPQF